MVLGAVVEVVQLLLEVVKDLCMTSHVRGQNQDDHVASNLLTVIIKLD